MTNPYGESGFVADQELSDAKQNVADQLAYIRRLIVRGGHTQAAEDRLRELEQSLLRARIARGRSHIRHRPSADAAT
jgi:hypothetical protein